MRFDTQRISSYVVALLKQSPSIERITHDGGDLVQLRTVKGDIIRLYFIENTFPIAEIRRILKTNTAEQVYSLFILWCDLLLPYEGQVLRPPDWMFTLQALGGGKIFAFDTFGTESFVFPVFFDGDGPQRTARYGAEVDVDLISVQEVELTGGALPGRWRMAQFAQTSSQHHQHQFAQTGQRPPDYALLDIDPGATRIEIKSAYRRLAMRYHPDRNSSPEAIDQMQAINSAYERLIAELED